MSARNLVGLVLVAVLFIGGVVGVSLAQAEALRAETRSCERILLLAGPNGVGYSVWLEGNRGATVKTYEEYSRLKEGEIHTFFYRGKELKSVELGNFCQE